MTFAKLYYLLLLLLLTFMTKFIRCSQANAKKIYVRWLWPGSTLSVAPLLFPGFLFLTLWPFLLFFPPYFHHDALVFTKPLPLSSLLKWRTGDTSGLRHFCVVGRWISNRKIRTTRDQRWTGRQEAKCFYLISSIQVFSSIQTCPGKFWALPHLSTAICFPCNHYRCTNIFPKGSNYS